jgi:hypothetical protein
MPSGVGPGVTLGLDVRVGVRVAVAVGIAVRSRVGVDVAVGEITVGVAAGSTLPGVQDGCAVGLTALVRIVAGRAITGVMQPVRTIATTMAVRIILTDFSTALSPGPARLHGPARPQARTSAQNSIAETLASVKARVLPCPAHLKPRDLV